MCLNDMNVVVKLSIRGPTGGVRREETKAREMRNILNAQYMLVGKLPCTKDGANTPKKNI